MKKAKGINVVWNPYNYVKRSSRSSEREYGESIVDHLFEAADDCLNGGYNYTRIETEFFGNGAAEVHVYVDILNENLEDEEVLDDTFLFWRTYPKKMRGTWNVARLTDSGIGSIGNVTTGFIKWRLKGHAYDASGWKPSISLYKKNLEFLKDIFRFVL